MATTALVLSILPLCVTWIAGVVMGILYLTGSPKDAPRRGQAVAAIVVAAVWTVACVVGAVLIIATTGPDRDADGTVTSEGTISAFDLQEGDCTTDVPDGTVFRLEVVPCDEPHRGEAFYTADLATGDYPGDDAVLEQSEKRCLDAFEDFVGMTYDESELEFSYLYPLEESWATDRSVTCLIASTDPTTGSAQNAAR